MRLALTLLFVPALFAQPNRDFFPWWEPQIVRDLNLSEDQSRQIENTVKEYRDRLVDLRANVEKAENQLSDLMNEDYPTAPRLDAAIEKSVQARADLQRTYTQMAARLRVVLTPDQWKELKRRNPGPGKFGPRREGPGGPGGPGPGGPAPGGQKRRREPDDRDKGNSLPEAAYFRNLEDPIARVLDGPQP